MNGKPVEMFLDSGAEINVIDESTYESIGRPVIQKCFEKGCLFDGTQRSFIGKGEAMFKFRGIRVVQDFYVAKNGSLNLLSINTMDEFGLLDDLKNKINNPAINLCRAGDENRGKTVETPSHPPKTKVHNHIETLHKNFSDVFKDGLGLCTKIKAHLSLQTDARPIYRKARPVPYNARDAVDGELDRWEKMGVIEKVEYTEWAAPILVVKKADGSARLCIDYSTGLNEALLDNQHPLPLPEDIFATLNGGKFFSQIDLKDAYLQV